MSETDCSSISDDLRKVIVKALRKDIEPSQVPNDNLAEALGISSVDALEILINVEVAFNIRVRDEDLGSHLLESLDNLAAYVAKRQTEQA